MSETIEGGAGAAMAIGRVLAGQYRIERLLGAGAMGLVYVARQLSVDREVVIKTLRLSPSDRELNALLSKRLRVEALATARLDHPNTVRLLDCGEDEDGTPFIVLELLRGRPLARVITEAGALAPEEAARIGVAVCRSLAEAHGAGVIHRDLKPDNVFLCDYPDERAVVKVMDFGVARMLPHTDSHVSRITAAGLTVGTPMYIAPEQARGLETSPATDLYALGAVLFEMLTGRPPFTGASGMELAIKHIKEPPPALGLSGLPVERAARWEALVASLLAKEPRQRPQSAVEVGLRLAALAEPPGATSPSASGPALSSAPTGPGAPLIAGHRRALLATAALASFLLGVLIGRLVG